MAVVVSYPSTEFPAPASCTLPCPPGWETVPVTDGLVAVRRTDHEADEFRPNVVATLQRYGAMSLPKAAELVVAALAENQDWEQIANDWSRGLGDLWVIRIEGSYTHPVAGRLHQVIDVAVLPRGDFFDLVQVIGTCAGAQAEGILPEISAILEGARLFDPGVEVTKPPKLAPHF
jgi:hypothetical protein